MRNQNLALVDSHLHFPWPGQWGRTEVKPELQAYLRQRNERMALEWDFPSSSSDAEKGQTWEELADRWHEEALRYDLRKLVFVTGGGNENLHQVVQRHPDRFAGLAHHRFWEDDGLDQLKRAVEEYGFVGLKALGPRVPVSFDDPKLVPLWEYMAARRLPALIHFGMLGTAGGVVYHPNMSPLVLANVGRAYPEIPFILPHFGCGYMHEALQLCWSLPNVFIDTSGSNQWMRWEAYPMTAELAFRKYYETIGPERILFGTDSSWFPRGFSYRYLQDQVRDLRQLNWRQEEIAAVMGGNAARLYGFDLSQPLAADSLSHAMAGGEPAASGGESAAESAPEAKPE